MKFITWGKMTVRHQITHIFLCIAGLLCTTRICAGGLWRWILPAFLAACRPPPAPQRLFGILWVKFRASLVGRRKGTNFLVFAILNSYFRAKEQPLHDYQKTFLRIRPFLFLFLAFFCGALASGFFFNRPGSGSIGKLDRRYAEEHGRAAETIGRLTMVSNELKVRGVPCRN